VPSLPRNIWRPAAYHGHPQSRGCFEGWYFKLVDPTERHRLAVIPGVFLGKDPATSHAFVQTLDGVTGRTTYHRFPLAEFRAVPAAFDLAIGPNRFTGAGIDLKLESPERHLVGTVRFGNITPWPVTWRSPGIMDWYSFVPFMECYHGVLSFDHELRGLLAVDGQAVDFHGGRGYIEKDWGQAFPRAWIWLQTNHFGAPGTCLTASVARIPWLGSAFRGFIAGFWWHGRLYRFATYTGARIERLEVTRDHVFWTLRGVNRIDGAKNEYRLELIAHRDEEGVDLLHAPYRTAMLQRVLESLTAQVDVRLVRLDSGRERTLFTGTGRHAGLEIGGAIEEIL
jgi:hypothetical protein